MSEEILKSIEEKLDVIIRLMVRQSFQETTQAEAILSLSNLGFETYQIAQALNIKSNIIRAEISREKKKKK